MLCQLSKDQNIKDVKGKPLNNQIHPTSIAVIQV